MTREEQHRLLTIHRRLRESHQKLFELQGVMIDTLREGLTSVAKTQEEMMEFFQAVNDLDDLAADEGQ